HSVVGLGEDRFGKVEAHLVLVDVEGGDKLDIADVIAAEVDMHESRDRGLRRRVAVVVHALDQRRGAVAYPHDGHANFLVFTVPLAVAMAVPLIGAHAPTSSRTFTLDDMPSIWSRRSRKRRMFSTSSEQ